MYALEVVQSPGKTGKSLGDIPKPSAKCSVPDFRWCRLQNLLISVMVSIPFGGSP